MLSSLNELFITIGSLIPRIKNILPYEKGIKFIWGSKVKIIDSGWTTYWPVSTILTIKPIVRQTTNLNYQILTTSDNKTIVVAAAILYHINDIKKYCIENYEVEETIIETASSIFREFITKNTFEEIIQHIGTGKLNSEITNKAYNELLPYGIEVEVFRLTDVAPTRVISLTNSAALTNINE